jgi:hypothetical protein
VWYDYIVINNDATTNGHHMLRTLLAALAVTTIIGGGSAAVAEAAQAAQPYGGCDEAYAYARSAGAQDCRDAGWTIRPRLVVGPGGWVYYSVLPHCRHEDGSGQRSACTWNFGQGQKDGNGRGRMIWNDEHDRTHYVKGWKHTHE